MRKISKIFGVILIFIIGCANPLPPSGGPPDKTPPQILETNPKSGTTNFKGDEVSITFDKYMNKGQVLENVYVSPSTKTEFSWSGKELYVEFPESLDSNTTYSVNLGTEYTDLHGNPPAEAYSLIFSTGDKIDSGSIKGVLYADEPAGAFIFAYPLDKINPDTLDPRHTKPAYRIQSGSTGIFDMKALKKGKYRLFTVKDILKNELYDEGMDGFGAATRDFIVADSIPLAELKLGPPQDKLKPQLYDAEALSNIRIAANFSEKLDTLSVTKFAFSIRDSLGRDTIPIASAYISTESPNRVEIVAFAVLDTLRKWKLTALAPPEPSVRDSSGNTIQDTANFTYFYGRANPDTLKPRIIYRPLKDSAENVSLDAGLDFIFNTGINRSGFNDRIFFISAQDSVTAQFEISWLADNRFNIHFNQMLTQDKWYILTLNLNKLEGQNGQFAADTTIKMKFKPKDTRDYGGVSGIIKYNEKYKGKIIIELKSKDNKQSYKTKPDNSGKWAFNDIPPGTYHFEVFSDSDGNGKYSYGIPIPFEYAEPFWYFAKEIDIRPRWKVEDLVIQLTE